MNKVAVFQCKGPHAMHRNKNIVACFEGSESHQKQMCIVCRERRKKHIA